MKDVLNSPIIMIGGLKSEYYIRRRILIVFKFFDQFLNFAKTTHTVSQPSYCKSANFEDVFFRSQIEERCDL